MKGSDCEHEKNFSICQKCMIVDELVEYLPVMLREEPIDLNEPLKPSLKR